MDRANKSTKLRYISTQDPDRLTQFVGQLGFKVEIKGSPVFADGKWFLYFTLPDDRGMEKIQNLKL